jgi:predicted nucleotidyltransferase
MQYKKLISEVVKPLKPYQVALFGSRARGNAKPDSDYDIMIWWKNKNFPKSKYDSEQDFSDKMYVLSEKLSQTLDAPVDLVVMRYTNKWKKPESQHDAIFYECVKMEAKYFYNIGGNELIDTSIKIGLYKT